MPVLLHSPLPAIEELQQEGCAIKYAPGLQGKMRVGIVNLMPNHMDTERQWLRLLAKIPLLIEVHFIRLHSWLPKSASVNHLQQHYQTLDQSSDFDALIITGAPLGTKEYEDVPYWSELRELFDMANYYANTTLYSCWAANAALYHFYNIPRRQRARKVSGIYEHRILRQHAMVKSMHIGVQFPHSRYAEARQSVLFAHPEVRVVMQAPNAGAFLAADDLRRRAFIFGHPEYEADTLQKEFKRDFDAGKDPHPPEYYFVDTETFALPEPMWQESGAVLLKNWLNLWAR